MKKQKVLIIGNKQYSNFKLDNIVDTFDLIYRFNLAWPNKNNGTKFGKLAMCGHIHQNFIGQPAAKEQIMKKYDEYDPVYLSNWYDYFQANKQNFEEIFHQNENNWEQWNKMLGTYGSPHRFSRMATTGYSTIFRNLSNPDNKIYVSCFTLCSDETRKTVGMTDKIAKKENEGGGCHSFSDEIKILNWLHNNKKIDASLCMINDTEKLNFKINKDSIGPSKEMVELIKKTHNQDGDTR